MSNLEFENRLNELNLSKKEFALLVQMPYQTMMNWKQNNKTPHWVEPFLNHYEKSKTLDEILGLMAKFTK
ncbi:hypothetical protein LMG7974_01639 [Campylobacter majalis]|uniref:XRE family transcriptional regulator n=1 Tax=Campylobacter majalis TaxID=2790656 RepID=A0ABM8Q997_9BACT|nr:hypothetical protein [Campylobacter majalis]CAD7289562.1 hypothetical protein LMG7974_01639 [Campylobacter majalis]